jgi:hypothetical protein
MFEALSDSNLESCADEIGEITKEFKTSWEKEGIIIPDSEIAKIIKDLSQSEGSKLQSAA